MAHGSLTDCLISFGQPPSPRESILEYKYVHAAHPARDFPMQTLAFDMSPCTPPSHPRAFAATRSVGPARRRAGTDGGGGGGSGGGEAAANGGNEEARRAPENTTRRGRGGAGARER